MFPGIGAYEDFESSTLTFGDWHLGWAGPGIVYSYNTPVAYEDYETSTLSSNVLPDFGWSDTGVVYTYQMLTSYEDFETSTLNSNVLPDFGWLGGGVASFATTITGGTAFVDLGGTITLTVAPVSVAPGTVISSYQWYQNGVLLTNAGEYSGVTTNALTITGVTNGDYTSYTCTIGTLGNTFSSVPFTLIDRATDWANRVVTNGGASPAGGTVTAIRTFVNGLITDGLSSKILMLNVFAADNLIAATTPLYRGAGSDPWTNHNFIAGDLTVNGLIGNSSSKYLDTGFVGTSTTLNNSGITIYGSVVSSIATDYDFGYTNNASTQMFAMKLDEATNTKSFINDIGSVGSFTSPGAGYYSANRVSSTDHRVYFANSGTAHIQKVLSSVANAASLQNRTTYVFAANAYELGTPFGYSGNRISFVAVTTGLSSGNSSNFFSRIQTLRTSLGGGFV